MQKASFNPATSIVPLSAGSRTANSQTTQAAIKFSFLNIEESFRQYIDKEIQFLVSIKIRNEIKTTPSDIRNKYRVAIRPVREKLGKACKTKSTAYMHNASDQIL